MQGWKRATNRIRQELARTAGGRDEPVTFERFDEVPAPAARYLRSALVEGQSRVRAARVVQRGEFRARESPDPAAGWRPFQAEQYFTVEPPGFVWDAAIGVAPGAWVRVRDAWAGGRASMVGALWGVLPVVRAADHPHLRLGALQRFLAESVWLPTALLPGPRLRWSAVDNRRARATLVDGGTEAMLEFEFAPGGEIVGCFTPERPRAVPGRGARYEMLPWGGRYAGWESCGGMRVPHRAEVYWVVDGREQPYYRGTNVRIDHELSGVAAVSGAAAR